MDAEIRMRLKWVERLSIISRSSLNKLLQVHSFRVKPVSPEVLVLPVSVVPHKFV